MKAEGVLLGWAGRGLTTKSEARKRRWEKGTINNKYTQKCYNEVQASD